VEEVALRASAEGKLTFAFGQPTICHAGDSADAAVGKRKSLLTPRARH